MTGSESWKILLPAQSQLGQRTWEACMSLIEEPPLSHNSYDTMWSPWQIQSRCSPTSYAALWSGRVCVAQRARGWINQNRVCTSLHSTSCTHMQTHPNRHTFPVLGQVIDAVAKMTEEIWEKQLQTSHKLLLKLIQGSYWQALPLALIPHHNLAVKRNEGERKPLNICYRML